MGEFDLILTRNDQAASLMADSYARVTGKTGVCMATLGPGAANLITGIANAYFDSIPLVAITGNTGLGSLKGFRNARQMGFQEMDIVSVAKPITKYAFMIKKPEDAARAIGQAFKIAQSGRKGPVLIDIPIDLQRMDIDKNRFISPPGPIESYDDYYIETDKLKTICEKIKYSKKPLIISGGGVILSAAESELYSFANQFNIPVATTLMGLSSFDQNEPLSLGFMGCYGSRYCNKCIADADLIIGLGNRFDIRAIGTEVQKFQEDKFVIHVDIDSGELGNRVKPDISIMSDVKEFLLMLMKFAEDNNYHLTKNSWIDGKPSDNDLFNDYYLKDCYEKVRPQYILRRICSCLDKEYIVTSDVGQHQMWVAQFMKFVKPRTHITSGGLGNMGFALPAAIAAKYAFKDKEVICISGDGSFQINIQELATAAHYKTPVKIFIMNNGTLGLVKQFQDKTFSEKATSTILGYNPDFVKIAEAYDAVGFNIKSAEQIDDIVLKALSIKDKTVLVNCAIDSCELALPELESGHYIDDQYPYA